MIDHARLLNGRFLLVAVFVLVAAFLWSQESNQQLRAELRQREGVEGLALLRTSPSNWWDVVHLDGSSRMISNPRGLSGGWFAANGNVVAWTIGSWPGEAFKACPSPVIVESSDGTPIWQLPGNVINTTALAVSADGRHVAFAGTYKPNGSGFLNTSENRSRWRTGLHVAEINSKTVSLIISTEKVGRISWSPDANQFVFDLDNRVYIYDVKLKTTAHLAEGSNPAWSPNGKWIGFRSPESEAQIVDPTTGEVRALQRRIIWGLHWSPDTSYVLFSERRQHWVPLLSPSTQLVVYRLRDGATLPVHGMGYQDLSSDQGFYWVREAEQFLKNAATHPTIQPCNESLP